MLFTALNSNFGQKSGVKSEKEQSCNPNHGLMLQHKFDFLTYFTANYRDKAEKT